MIQYTQTQNLIPELEPPKIQGYKKQFSMPAPRGESQEEPVPVIKPEIKPEIKKGTVTYKSENINVGNMQDVIDKLTDAGISIRITSGLRDIGEVGNAGNRSHHPKGDAIDITPGEGETWESMIDKIKNNTDLKDWFRNRGVGILEETSPDIMRQTGATGAHWHIGPDAKAKENFEKLFAKQGTKISEFENGVNKTKAILAKLGSKLPDIKKPEA